ncbi:carbohydrate porin [Acinetobacter sichuanensis]|uniref:Carbohydrate porin n=1 Tax=Acinetobacter sichuanensis TaxID=2136183 RepID=A0A371YNR4_9GAMM|nr:carbohydrate porin [Acinetobacter sichuanensis]RFC82994.1 carbohydrate porin [Acinetobacter sichuanensis]
MKSHTSCLYSCISLVACAIYAQHALAASSTEPWMLGDWDGERSALVEQGYDFTFDYTGEMANILDSKKTTKNGTEFSGQLGLGAHLDLNKILGWQDTDAQITITYRDGKNLTNTAPALEGQISSVQEVWGREQTWRLTNFWIRKKIHDQALDIKIGRFGEAEDFNSFACDFQNLALCGSQMGNWAGDQWFNWPVSQWAARVKYNFTPDFYTQIGVFEYNPENLERGKGFNLSTDESKGALIPVEMVWTPSIGAQHLSGEYRIGYYFSTADANELDGHGQALETTDHKKGGWISGKQKLISHRFDSERGLTASASAVFFDSKTNVISNMQNLAFSYLGAWSTRPKDEIAIGFARIHKNAEGFSNEYNSELYYGIHLTDWFTLRPNVQYIKNVGAVSNGNNTWVAGIKFNTTF